MIPLESHSTGKYIFKTNTGIPETLFFSYGKVLQQRKQVLYITSIRQVIPVHVMKAYGGE